MIEPSIGAGLDYSQWIGGIVQVLELAIPCLQTRLWGAGDGEASLRKARFCAGRKDGICDVVRFEEV